MLRPQRQDAPTLRRVPIRSGAGLFIAHFSDQGLAGLNFPATSPETSGCSKVGEVSNAVKDWADLARESVIAVLSGQPPRLLPPLDLRAGTEFQQQVWAALQGIDLGQTKTYGEIAAEIGSPKATRAVGRACGANPIPLLIPCHRVLASGGKLGGFSGGLSWKTRLLTVEGVTAG